MKQISGYVLVKETNLGIPNLIVTAYNSEKKSIQSILAEQPNRHGFSLESLGRRIGSVLTDQNGNFILESENLEFEGNESRPDLLIIIFAPEDVQDVKTPYPLPPEERILYISAVPRQEAGAKEAFVIRLLQEQLEQFQISATTSANESNMGEERLATAIEGAWHLGDRSRDRLKASFLRQQERSESFQYEARQKVTNLSAIPKYLRNRGLTNCQLLINGKRDLADNLKLKQDQVIENGLERLKSRNTVVRLRLTEDEVKDLGLTIRKDGEIAGKIDLDKLTEKVRTTMRGVDLVRKRGLNNPSPEALIKKYLLNTPIPRSAKVDTHNK